MVTNFYRVCLDPKSAEFVLFTLYRVSRAKFGCRVSMVFMHIEYVLVQGVAEYVFTIKPVEYLVPFHLSSIV